MARPDQQKQPRKRSSRRRPSDIATRSGVKQHVVALSRGHAPKTCVDDPPRAISETHLAREERLMAREERLMAREERLKENIKSLTEQQEGLRVKNAPLNKIRELMRQECINQGVEPRAFSTQWASTEVGKEMMERSARIAELHEFIIENQNKLSTLKQK